MSNYLRIGFFLALLCGFIFALQRFSFASELMKLKKPASIATKIVSGLSGGKDALADMTNASD